MTLLNSAGHASSRTDHGVTGPQLALAGAAAGAFLITAALRDALPGAAVLPALSTLLLTVAAVIATLSWRRPSRHRFTYLDAAGVLTFIGLCIAALIEPQQMPGLLTERR